MLTSGDDDWLGIATMLFFGDCAYWLGGVKLLFCLLNCNVDWPSVS